MLVLPLRTDVHIFLNSTVQRLSGGLSLQSRDSRSSYPTSQVVLTALNHRTKSVFFAKRRSTGPCGDVRVSPPCSSRSASASEVPMVTVRRRSVRPFHKQISRQAGGRPRGAHDRLRVACFRGILYGGPPHKPAVTELPRRPFLPWRDVARLVGTSQARLRR